jgi:hypothetical protein
MNFKEFFEKSPKTYVYHVSPDSSIRKLRATSARKGLQAVKQGDPKIRRRVHQVKFSIFYLYLNIGANLLFA